MQAKDFANTCGSVVIPSFREMAPRFCSPQTYLRRGTRDLSFSVIAKSRRYVVASPQFSAVTGSKISFDNSLILFFTRDRNVHLIEKM
jgi:hypothetical protein